MKLTPMTAFEYLSDQLVSRVMVSSFVVWLGCDLIFSFQVQGRGVLRPDSGLRGNQRGTDQRDHQLYLLAHDVPVIGVVSHRGSGWLDPLTHFFTAARKVINDGVTLFQVSHEVMILMAMSLVFLAIGSRLFSWTR